MNLQAKERPDRRWDPARPFDRTRKKPRLLFREKTVRGLCSSARLKRLAMDTLIAGSYGARNKRSHSVTRQAAPDWTGQYAPGRVQAKAWFYEIRSHNLPASLYFFRLEIHALSPGAQEKFMTAADSRICPNRGIGRTEGRQSRKGLFYCSGSLSKNLQFRHSSLSLSAAIAPS